MLLFCAATLNTIHLKFFVPLKRKNLKLNYYLESEAEQARQGSKSRICRKKRGPCMDIFLSTLFLRKQVFMRKNFLSLVSWFINKSYIAMHCLLLLVDRQNSSIIFCILLSLSFSQITV